MNNVSTMFNSREIIKVVDQLVGPTTTVGSSAFDKEIDKNLKNLIDLVNWALDGIADSARTRHCSEESMRITGERAFSALCEWKDWIEATINLD